MILTDKPSEFPERYIIKNARPLSSHIAEINKLIDEASVLQDFANCTFANNEAHQLEFHLYRYNCGDAWKQAATDTIELLRKAGYTKVTKKGRKGVTLQIALEAARKGTQEHGSFRDRWIKQMV